MDTERDEADERTATLSDLQAHLADVLAEIHALRSPASFSPMDYRVADAARRGAGVLRAARDAALHVALFGPPARITDAPSD